MNDNIIEILVEEIERRRDNNTTMRRLRDNSNPFELPQEIFRQMYRLDVEAAQNVFGQIRGYLENTRISGIPPIVKFFTALHFFAHGSYQKSVGKDFQISMSQASVSRCIHQVTNAINRAMARQITFPIDRNDKISVKTRFFEKYGVPGIVGCIDCTHVAIFPPPAHYPGFVFINRKGFHSINCQIICDSQLKILNLNARFPGSVHDSAIWQMSQIKTHLLQNYMDGDRHSWLFGDSGYPLQPFLLVPIVGAQAGTPEAQYTECHCIVRNCVERCIGLLKAYFRCLRKDRVLHYKPDFAANIINACGILHNVLRERNLHNLNEDEMQQNDYEIIAGPRNEIPDNNLLNEGNIVRNNLIQQLF